MTKFYVPELVEKKFASPASNLGNGNSSKCSVCNCDVCFSLAVDDFYGKRRNVQIKLVMIVLICKVYNM